MARLSWPGWLVTQWDSLPTRRQSPIPVLTGIDVEQLRWSRPTRYRYTKSPPVYCFKWDVKLCYTIPVYNSLVSSCHCIFSARPCLPFTHSYTKFGAINYHDEEYFTVDGSPPTGGHYGGSLHFRRENNVLWRLNTPHVGTARPGEWNEVEMMTAKAYIGSRGGVSWERREGVSGQRCTWPAVDGGWYLLTERTNEWASAHACRCSRRQTWRYNVSV